MLQGTDKGKAQQFSLRTTFLFSAVNVTGMSPADETRIAFLELRAHESDAATARLVSAECQFFADLGPAWCGWMVANVAHLQPTIEAFQAAMPHSESRHRQNLSTLFAGAFIAVHGRPPTPSEAEAWCAGHAEVIEHQRQAGERNDALEALDHLWAHPVRETLGETLPLAYWIARAIAKRREPRRQSRPDRSEQIIASYDIRIELEDTKLEGCQPGVLIRNGSPAMDRVYQNTRWGSRAWRRALGQIPGVFTPENPIRFVTSTQKSRCVGIPLELVPPPYEEGEGDEADEREF